MPLAQNELSIPRTIVRTLLRVTTPGLLRNPAEVGGPTPDDTATIFSEFEIVNFTEDQYGFAVPNNLGTFTPTSIAFSDGNVTVEKCKWNEKNGGQFLFEISAGGTGSSARFDRMRIGTTDFYETTKFSYNSGNERWIWEGVANPFPEIDGTNVPFEIYH